MKRQFEWDETKRLSNATKHGLDFIDIIVAFDDPGAVFFPSASKDAGEERTLMVATYDTRLVTIVVTLRGIKTRIISARAARPDERRRYDRG